MTLKCNTVCQYTKYISNRSLDIWIKNTLKELIKTNKPSIAMSELSLYKEQSGLFSAFQHSRINTKPTNTYLMSTAKKATSYRDQSTKYTVSSENKQSNNKGIDVPK